MIADLLRFGRINNEVLFGDYRYKARQTLTRARFHVVSDLTREKQRFINELFKKYSAFTQEKIFSDSFSATALALYEAFDSVEDLAYMDLHDLTAFIIQKGKNRFKDPESVVKAIQKAARSSYRLPKTVNDSVNQVLLSLLFLCELYKTKSRNWMPLSLNSLNCSLMFSPLFRGLDLSYLPE